MNRTVCAFFLLILVTSFSLLGKDQAGKRVTILASGETHGMLHPCDCPGDQGGGLATRASVIADMRRQGPVLLLDAGGFSAGSIYDTYTEGREKDSVRTLATIRAMGAMGYDAAALGDEELRYSLSWLLDAARKYSLPILSANCRSQDGQLVATPTLIVTREGVRYGITAVTTQERLFALDPSVIIEDPVSSVRAIWSDLVASSDVQIILSHLGEDESRRLVSHFPDAEIIINGHRKTSTAPSSTVGGSTVMQFGFQGKQLAVAEGLWDGKSLRNFRGRWVSVPRSVKPDPTIESLISNNTSPLPSFPVFDLYVMSLCPYGLPAIHEMATLARNIAGVSFNVWFIGSVGDDSIFSSLHGREEVEDEMMWLAVKDLHPDRWMEFLSLRSSQKGATTKKVIQTLGLDMRTIESWIAEKGQEQLAFHYRRSTRLNVTASPTLFINNTVYEGEIHAGRLGRNLCRSVDSASTWCDSLPECFDHTDCREPGKIGECSKNNGPARCVFKDDVAFTFSVLRSASTRSRPEEGIIQTTRELFPAAIIEVIDIDTDRGKKLYQTHKPSSLPLYQFAPQVREAANFSRIEQGLVDKGAYLTFKEGVVPGNFYPEREMREGRIDIYADPLMVDTLMVRILERATKRNPRISLLPVFFADPTSTPAGIEEKVRQEEAQRWIVLSRTFPNAFFRYVSLAAQAPGSTYWSVAIEKAGIRMRRFMKEIAEPKNSLSAYWSEIGGLEIRDPVTVVLDNQEVIRVRNMRELEEVLGRKD